MKKIIAIILTLCLLCGAVALADSTVSSQTNNVGQTTVTYTIEEEPAKYDYILTIPADIDLTNGTQSMQVKLDTTGVTGTDKKISVKMSADYDVSGNQYFTLTSGENVIRYEIKNSKGTNVYANAESIMIWTPGSSPAEGYTANWTASVVEDDLTNAAAGDYSDTLSFTVSLDPIA